MRTAVVVLAVGLLTCRVSVADEPAERAADAKRLERWVEYYTQVAQEYDVRLKSAPDERLTVSAKPILVYSNPTIGLDTHGAFFVWTRNGRAEAIAAIWSKRIGPEVTSRKNVNHEFHSLATEPLAAKGADGVTWEPAEPGLEFKPVPDAPVPGTTRAKRLSQMRQISRQFTGFDLNPRSDDPNTEEERRMRLLPAPMYRYAEAPTAKTEVKAENRSPPVTDGAVFGLFFDWDPEILLVLEVRPTDDGPRWHYAVAYVDYKPLRLQLNGQDVWEKPEKNFGHPRGKYFCVIGVTTQTRDLETP